MNAIEIEKQIQETQQKLNFLIQELDIIQAKCNHKWSYNEIQEQYYTGNKKMVTITNSDDYDRRGDNEIAFRTRYERFCLFCHKTEHTYKKIPTKYEPIFE